MDEAIEIYVQPEETKPLSWRVEQIDSDGDGGVDVAIFSGPHAKERAREFADWLKGITVMVTPFGRGA